MHKKLFIFYLLSFLILSYTVNSAENDSEEYDDTTEGVEDNEENVTNVKNQTLSIKNSTKTEDYEDYGDESDESNDEDEEVEECGGQTLVDKIRVIHEEGKKSIVSRNVNTINDTFNILSDVRLAMSSLFGINDRERLKIYEFLSEIDLRISSQCLAAVLKVFTGISETQIWALKFIDSMGSIPPKGFLDGVFSDFGEYDECLNIKSHNSGDNSPIIRGKYCLMNVILPFPLKDSDQKGIDLEQRLSLFEHFEVTEDIKKFTLKSLIEALNIVNGTIYRMGVCMPDACQPKEIEGLVNKIFQPITKLPVEINNRCIVLDEPIVLDSFQMISITILSILVLLVISSSVYEYFSNSLEPKLPESSSIRHPTKTEQMMKSFSIINNTRLLFEKSPQKWQALDTIRLFLILYVHVAHFYLFTSTFGLPFIKRAVVQILPRMFHDSRYFFARNPAMIDCLYTLSGFLISYGLLRKLEQSKGRFNYPVFIFQQWIRFTILGFGSILFFYLFPFTGEGPIWENGAETTIYGCKQPWTLLRILFFVNNVNEFRFETFHESCNIPLWFLSALMQFLIISPAFIILYHKNKRLGTYAITVAIIFFAFLTMAPLFVLGVKPYLQVLVYGAKLLSQNVNESINWYHTYPNVQAVSYFIGIAAGFVLKNNVAVTPKQTKIFWFCSVFGIISMYVWYDSFWKPADEERYWGAIIYTIVGKPFFSVCIAWIYFALCTGRAGFFGKFLSWSGFQPIARLSFGIFILHVLVVSNRIYNHKYTYAGNNYMMWRFLFIDFCFDIMLAYIFYILIECPFANIFKVLYSRRPPEKPTELPIDNVINNLNIRLDLGDKTHL